MGRCRILGIIVNIVRIFEVVSVFGIDISKYRDIGSFFGIFPFCLKRRLAGGCRYESTQRTHRKRSVDACTHTADFNPGMKTRPLFLRYKNVV